MRHERIDAAGATAVATPRALGGSAPAGGATRSTPTGERQVTPANDPRLKAWADG